MRRVVITGYGILSPIGNNKEELKDSFYNKKSGVVTVEEWKKIDGLRSFVAGTVKNLNKKILDRKSRRSMGDVALFNTISAKKDWPTTGFQADGGRGLRTVFARALEEMDSDIKSMPNEIDAVQTAMDMENQTLDYYKEQSQKAKYEAERDFYKTLAAQESEHHLVLLDYYEFLKDPAAWFVQKEHPSLDGG